jgi:hypothetical protein
MFLKHGRLAALAVCTALAASVVVDRADAAAPLGWSPRHTYVFAVGILEWKRSDLWASFPEAVPNRRDAQLVRHFRDQGVPNEQIVFLKDAAATKHEIHRRFVELLDETDEGDLLVFYFAGHGSRDRATGRTSFANYDAGDEDSSAWNVANIFKTIDAHFSGSRVLLLADCCHSGALYDEVARRADDDVGYAALTSSSAHNSSTGAWTFTDSLLHALRGRPYIDYDRDGDIDLNETARYVEGEMAFVEGQKSMFLARGPLKGETTLALAAGTSRAKAGFHCEAWSEGEWWKAEVLEFDEASNQYHIHYVGYSSKYDEWQPAKNIRGYEPRQFAAGTTIQARWNKKWYPAQVVRSWYGLHLVHYDGYDSTWDEWLGPESVRPR